jgi:hypothetical protein
MNEESLSPLKLPFYWGIKKMCKKVSLLRFPRATRIAEKRERDF